MHIRLVLSLMSHRSKSPAVRTWPGALREAFSYMYMKYNIIYIYIYSLWWYGMWCYFGTMQQATANLQCSIKVLGSPVFLSQVLQALMWQIFILCCAPVPKDWDRIAFTALSPLIPSILLPSFIASLPRLAAATAGRCKLLLKGFSLAMEVRHLLLFCLLIPLHQQCMCVIGAQRMTLDCQCLFLPFLMMFDTMIVHLSCSWSAWCGRPHCQWAGRSCLAATHN